MDTVRTTSTHPDFFLLTQQLDVELTARYGDLQLKYDALNQMDPLETALIGYVEETPMACGCFKILNDQAIEIKRLYVRDADRKRGFGIVMIEAG